MYWVDIEPDGVESTRETGGRTGRGQRSTGFTDWITKLSKWKATAQVRQLAGLMLSLSAPFWASAKSHRASAIAATSESSPSSQVSIRFFTNKHVHGWQLCHGQNSENTFL